MTPWLRGLWLWASLGIACVWPSPERQLLIDYFEACRAYDTTVLARMGTVPCNPRTDGVVEAFEVLGVGGTATGSSARMVRIRARVRPHGGASSDRLLTVRLERVGGRWLVTAIEPTRSN